MPYVFNRYLLPMVVMGVLLAVFFLLLVYVVVFPLQAREQMKLDAEGEREEAVAAQKSAERNYEKLLDLLGGAPGMGSEFSKTDEKAIMRLWMDYMESPTILKERCDTIDSLRLNFEALVKEQDGKINSRDEEIASRISEVNSVESTIREIYVRVFDSEIPRDNEGKLVLPPRMDQLQKISEELRSLQAIETNAEKDRNRYTKRIEELEADLEKTGEDYDEQLDAKNKELTRLRKERDTFEEKATSMEERVIQLEKELSPKEKETKTITVIKERFEATPDGEVLLIRGTGVDARGAVNIGRKHKAHPGMIFEVFRGENRKGRIQLYQVDDRESYFRILELYEDDNPILEDDQIHSPFYRRGVPTQFVVIGRFPAPLSRAKVIDRIQEWGGKVVDKIDANTKYAVIGEGIPPEEARNAIQLYNVETISIAGLSEFLSEE